MVKRVRELVDFCGIQGSANGVRSDSAEIQEVSALIASRLQERQRALGQASGIGTSRPSQDTLRAVAVKGGGGLKRASPIRSLAPPPALDPSWT